MFRFPILLVVNFDFPDSPMSSLALGLGLGALPLSTLLERLLLFIVLPELHLLTRK